MNDKLTLTLTTQQTNAVLAALVAQAQTPNRPWADTLAFVDAAQATERQMQAFQQAQIKHIEALQAAATKE